PFRTAYLPGGPDFLPHRARGGRRGRHGGDRMIATLQEWLSNPLLVRWEGGPWEATLVTLYMTAVTMALTVLLGLPLGVALYETDDSASPLVRRLNQVTGFVGNVLRSFPFFILIIALIPITSAITGRSTGPNAAMIALTIAAVAFPARRSERELGERPAGQLGAACTR